MLSNMIFQATIFLSIVFVSTAVSANLRQLDYPLRVAYINKVTSWWGDGVLKGLAVPGYASSQASDYNYLMLGFWSCSLGPLDIALLWHEIGNYGITGLGVTTNEIQTSIRQIYHDNGIKVLVSAFGSTEFPTTAGMDPVKCGHDLGQFVLDNNLDGADADWQDSKALQGGSGEQWLISFTKALREKIPNHIVAHSPQGPYFFPSKTKYPGGGYRHIETTIGADIDFYFVQYYNQEATSYDTYQDIFIKTTKGWFPGTSVKQIADGGVPLQKLVVGKPVLQSDAYNTGWVSMADLGVWGKQAYAEFGWYAGFGHWQYSSDPSGKAIRDAAGPLVAECINGGKCTGSNNSNTTNTTDSNTTDTNDTSPTPSPTPQTDLRKLSYPLRVGYVNKIASWWGDDILKGLGVPGYAVSKPSDYNIIMLSFWFCGKDPKDVALLWKNVGNYGISGLGTTSKQIQAAIRKKYNDNGIKVIISAFGAAEFPTTAGYDAATCGKNLAQFVIDNNLDGADVDWEDNKALEAGTGEQWLIDFTRAYREISPNTILAHAPQAPYFSGSYYKNGGYGKVEQTVGDMIDFYFIQFYNQGITSYDTYRKLFISSKGAFHGTSVKEIADRGISLKKLVIGKPLLPSDAINTGFVAQANLGAWAAQAYDAFGWYAGVGHWQYSSGVDGQAIRQASGPLLSKCAGGTCV